MSREEAIQLASTKLKCLRCQTDKENPCAHWPYDCRDCKYLYQGTIEKQKEWLEMAIKALKQKPCEDAVSRQALLNMTTTIQIDDLSGNEILEVVEVDDIKALPPVTITSKSKWIPVSKRLPKLQEDGNSYRSGRLLVTIEVKRFSNGCVSKDTCVTEGYYCFSDKKWHTRYNDVNVIAWQPLPEPYEEESESE